MPFRIRHGGSAPDPWIETRPTRRALVPKLKLENGISRCNLDKTLRRGSLGDREEALYLGSEAIKIGFEDRRTQLRRNVAHPIAPAMESADQRYFARRTVIAHPVGFTSWTNKIAVCPQVERIDGN